MPGSNDRPPLLSLLHGTPVTLTVSELVEGAKLRTYLGSIRDRLGVVRLSDLTGGGDSREAPIDRLFVEPLLTRRHVSPDEDPSRWRHRTETIFDALGGVRPLMLLGDPGTGKSTLLNYLAWLLARPTGEAWSRRMGAWLLPVPMLLRELRLDGVKTFAGLLDAFLHHAIGEPLRDGEYLKQMLEHGALLLLDGIDETGDAAVRRRLRNVVFDGFARYPRCRWLAARRNPAASSAR